MNENMLPVGTVLRAGAYRIERQIGAGGFGNTYVVWNQHFNERQAMKEFFMKEINLRDGSDVTVSIPGKKSTFEAQRSKFMKEAQRLWKLNNPHIVKVHDLFEENGTVYFVMDLIDGQSLADTVKTDGPMDEAKAMNIFQQMLDALKVVHSQNPMMLHLDIKPSNIMLDKTGNAFLLDFGSSKQVDTDNNMTSSAFTLTRGYAPSELIDGNKDRIGPWTDLYELGATLYHILTGQRPPTVSEITEYGENAFSFPSPISDNTRKLIFWLMSLSRDKRPKSVVEVQRFYGKPEPDNGYSNVGDEATRFDGTTSNDETVYEQPSTARRDTTGQRPTETPREQIRQRPPKPNPHMALAILSTLLCFPFGILAIVNATKVDTLYYDKDYEGAKEMAEKAKSWSMWAFYIWGGLGILFFLFFIFAILVS